MPMKQKPIDWEKYPIRMCYTMHECRLCGGSIVNGSTYRDGGYGRRAHVRCVWQKRLQDGKHVPH
jgi:hypothetical protein